MSKLSLKYAFVPSPYPIRASVSGANPNTVDLRVTLSPPRIAAVTMREIQIQIPVGGEIAGDLSDAPGLPAPSGLSGAHGWDVSSAGSVVTLLGDPDGTAVSGPISFTLAQVAVNQTEGTVPITITEYPPAGAKVIDDDSYSLLKESADFPISSFLAAPAVLYDVDQTVTLTWTCSDQGQDYVYSLQGGSWSSGDCLGDASRCLTCTDGAAGIVSPGLAETTTFTLDVIGIKDGHRAIRSTLQVVVPVLVPVFSQQYSTTQMPLAGGRFVSIHWLAQNAAYCSVLVDNRVVVSGAPTDTYVDGFVVDLGEPGSYGLSVSAYASQGSASTTLQLGSFVVGAGRQVPLDAVPSAVTITADSTEARVGCVTQDDPAFVLRIDLATGAGVEPSFTLYRGSAIILAPGGDACALIDYSCPQLFWLTTPPQQSNMAPSNSSCAVFDGLRFVQYVSQPPDDSDVLTWMAVDISDTWTASGSLSGVPAAVAPLTDGQALATIPASNELNICSHVDPSGFPVRIDLTGRPGVVAGWHLRSRAVVAYPDERAVGIIDLQTQSEETRIGVGGGPAAISLTPDDYRDGTHYNNKLAFVANHADSTVTVIDLVRRAAVSTFAVPPGPVAMAVSPDYRYLVVACDTGRTLLVL